MERSQSFLLVTSRLIDASNSICQFDAATPGSGRLYKASRSLEQASVSSSKLSKMDQLTLSASSWFLLSCCSWPVSPPILGP
ncbi:hypothetical protein PAHAL_8G023800 [Panicum hallii]|uniref:Uncharacterized protein n=1 Tax=Panicum hallii TaxID=206008 RepID=A0A2T8I7B7_9POAL|nr:hypothetical protein PAHAL_8G023800 [Panicum hallii]